MISSSLTPSTQTPAWSDYSGIVWHHADLGLVSRVAYKFHLNVSDDVGGHSVMVRNG